MALHDDYARLTPLEVAFPDLSALDALAAEAGEEARRRGVDETDPEAFMALSAVGQRLGGLRAESAPPESAYPFATLLYHAARFARTGRALYLLDTAAVRSLVRPELELPAAPSGVARPPHPAGYLQLPRHLVWVAAGSASTDATRSPESLDGAFWSVSREGTLHVLPISGLLPGRPGFGALPLPAAPLADAGAWLDATVRRSGQDFTSELPGADLDDLYVVEAAGEILKLMARFFVLAEGSRARLESCTPREAHFASPMGREPSRGATPGAGAPPPSALPYTRVSLRG